ncbi:hypothetical protein DOQ08_00231 [Marinobacter litoralis]|uniref:Uncharacterized protein n=1 Tax=Marinobacter litoralis TaxID=187981 RepID=A0A3M2RJQ8_9GAMM|nr:hypothetical protein DOQ08_00231 [Marinobacter litoralis]
MPDRAFQKPLQAHPCALLSGHPWPTTFLESSIRHQLPNFSVSCSKAITETSWVFLASRKCLIGDGGVMLLKMCVAMDGEAEAPHGFGRALMKQSFMRQPNDRNLRLRAGPRRGAEGAVFRSPTPMATHHLTIRLEDPILPNLKTYICEAQGGPPSPDELHQDHQPIAEHVHRQTVRSAGSRHR